MLRVENLHTFRGRIHALKGVGIHLNAGEIFAVVGPNGAGKSTLLGTIAGLYRPSQGRVWFEGAEVTGTAPEELVRRGLALVPERRQVFQGLSVRDNLLLGAYHRYRQQRQTLERDIEDILTLFPRLRQRIGQAAGSLSGGEQQMLAVGRALMARPKLLILDEPSLGLAPKMIAELFEAFVDMRKSRGLTILLVEQNIRAALGIADRGLVLERGRVKIEGSVSELKTHPQVEAAYLGRYAEASASPGGPAG
ncbi:ABC transporter ATP-binding protein [Kyrpidia sp.]|uniref:ABC transporter ATP-binding protein n=1 Tax=Kyrpidia sp. TaxID=2073077 RepID=UPI0025832EDF|nr:ABC transporter ATP-binding protein [Kyrpidia sp.]MCL6574690.1 ABC transporter ATP-binding protein [Kyrpidia sp.]